MPELLVVPAAPGDVVLLLEPPDAPMPELVPELEYVPGAADVEGATDPLSEPPAEPIPDAVPEAAP